MFAATSALSPKTPTRTTPWAPRNLSLSPSTPTPTLTPTRRPRQRFILGSHRRPPPLMPKSPLQRSIRDFFSPTPTTAKKTQSITRRKIFEYFPAKAEVSFTADNDTGLQLLGQRQSLRLRHRHNSEDESLPPDIPNVATVLNIDAGRRPATNSINGSQCDTFDDLPELTELTYLNSSVSDLPVATVVEDPVLAVAAKKRRKPQASKIGRKRNTHVTTTKKPMRPNLPVSIQTVIDTNATSIILSAAPAVPSDKSCPSDIEGDLASETFIHDEVVEPGNVFECPICFQPVLTEWTGCIKDIYDALCAFVAPALRREWKKSVSQQPPLADDLKADREKTQTAARVVAIQSFRGERIQELPELRNKLRATICRKHFLQSVRAEATKNGWPHPENIDLGSLEARIRRLSPFLQTLIYGAEEVPNEQQYSNKNRNSEGGGTVPTATAAPFFIDVAELGMIREKVYSEYERVGGAVFRCRRHAVCRHEQYQPGYMGDVGSVQIISILNNMYLNSPEFAVPEDFVEPLTPMEFVEEVLAPTVGCLLVAEDMAGGWSTDKPARVPFARALQRMQETIAYGSLLFPIFISHSPPR